MSTKISLLGLPPELLVRILELHFQEVKVKLSGRYRRKGDPLFLSLMLSCRTLSGIAERSFLDNAEMRVHSRDMVHFKDDFGHRPFLEGVKHSIVSRCPGIDEDILYPVQLFRNLFLDDSSFENFLYDELDDPLGYNHIEDESDHDEDEDEQSEGVAEQSQIIRTTFPFVRSLLTECTIYLPYVDTGTIGPPPRTVEAVKRLYQVMSQCADVGITLHVMVTFECRDTEDHYYYLTNTFRCVLTEDRILPYKATVHERSFYDHLRDLLESVFGCELDPWTGDLRPGEGADYEFEGVQWLDLPPWPF